jgi:hypothetical protein
MVPGQKLVRHAQNGDFHATSLLINEIRDSLAYLVKHYGDRGTATSNFAQQLLSVAWRYYEEFCSDDAEFSQWIEGILRREVEEACRCRWGRASAHTHLSPEAGREKLWGRQYE